MLARLFANGTGCRNGTTNTITPSRIFEVRAAIAVNKINGSKWPLKYTPRASDNIRSPTNMASNPSRSASTVYAIKRSASSWVRVAKNPFALVPTNFRATSDPQKSGYYQNDTERTPVKRRSHFPYNHSHHSVPTDLSQVGATRSLGLHISDVRRERLL